jgi:hypothetical protein
MTTLQMPQLSAPQQAELERTFFDLANRWRNETALLSSVTKIAMHPAYQRIIGMGPAALPLLLRELEQQPDHWFWALTAITGEDPVPPEDAGNMESENRVTCRCAGPIWNGSFQTSSPASIQ